MDKLGEFLVKDRGIPEENVQRMRDKKFDCSVLLLLDDEELSDYLPLYGDRLAAKNFARIQVGELNSEKATRKVHLRNLRARMHKRSPASDDDSCGPSTSTKWTGNKSAAKTTRRVELGWVHLDEYNHQYKQVRSKTGGGIRHLKVSKTITAGELLDIAKKLFFPDGKSSRGQMDEFNVNIRDFKHDVVDTLTTIDSMYQCTKVRLLRLYMSTCCKQDSPDIADDSSNDELPSLSVASSDESTEFVDAGTPTVQIREPLSQRYNFSQAPSSPVSEVAETTGQGTSETTETNLPGTSLQVTASSPVIQRHDTLEQPRSPTPPHTSTHDVITIHRSKVQQEMIRLFMDPAMVVSPIKYHFINELGADSQGVSRDVYSSFWTQFFETSSVGESERVPNIFPDYGRDEWESIGRILLKGYVDTDVYPIQLSYAFACAVIYGEAEVSGDMFVESLRMYLSDTDRSVIDKALMNEELDTDEQDDFLDLLGRVNCHSIPAKDEIRPMIISIAHKELIQEPKYALDSISCVAGSGLKDRIPHPDALHEMYACKTPNPRKVIKLLDSSPINQEQTAALSYLKQFIKGLYDRLIRKFMRIVTGSEYICISSIKVTFNRMRGFGRAPLMHTCGPLLELPSTYGSYPELRSEFMNILDANYLNMDIV